MKKIFLGLFLALIAWEVSAVEPQTTKSEIKSVTVFRQGAQITRTAKIYLKAGKNEVVFPEMETNIDQRTIQATAPTEVIIYSVTHEVNYLKEKEESPRIKRLTDSLEILNNALDEEKMRRTVIDKELAMVLANQDLKGSDKGLTAEELEKAANFFRKRLNDIYSLQLNNTRKQEKLSKEMGKIRNQLKELNYRKNQPSNDIVVLMETQQAKTIEVALRYYVQNAGWTPGYDLRANSTEGPVSLNYRADVYQQTGHDWEGVFLTLSTGNPNQGGTKPVLGQWNLAVYEPVTLYDLETRGARGSYKKSEKAPASESYAADDDWGAGAGEEVAEEEPAYDFFDETGLSTFTEVSEGATTAEFKISLKQDVFSGEKPQQVTIQKSELPAFYQHFAVPKLDKDAFLLARVTEWEELNLLPGNVNIFFEGTYVGQAYLNADFTQDTLDFSMGRDKKVVIERNQLKDFNRTKTLGGSRERTFGYEIVVRNTKKEKVSLMLEENVPVSQDKDISVKVEELSGGKHDEATGKVTWELELEPSETRKLTFIFEVKYPKNKQISGW